ncbi:hypothetical protein WOLCODRAFT_151671 [Wolfiporia cocos MD-104 SS10]|uniref:Uncharacterized protein n=1 Tax=Wolfiporia cocos (strain MD-104) TaxID=742152 RepID=A0A2H3JHF0_WOLCO|nr:hypothetical protein WOLCODRAFT_151671 [Wolfiporia cocos MD-104 SS10]
MGRLYTNSLLATLNARKILRMRTAGDDFLSALSMQELEGLGAATHNDQVGGLAPAINTASFKGPESDGESTQCGSPSVKVA